MNGRTLARRLEWSETKVSRLLSGQAIPPEIDVAAFLAVCGVTGSERERLLKLTRETATPGWLQQHGSVLPEQLKTLIDHENRAVEVLAFEEVRIPGLLQTGDYARCLLERSANVPPAEIPERVEARHRRQGIFARPGRPDFSFFVHEFALRLPVGGREVMSDQLHQLLRLSVRSYITIRLIPAAFGAHASMAGACRLMRFDDLKPVAYIEEQTAGHFLEETAEIAAYEKIFAALADCALDEEDSRERIAALAIELYGEDHNASGVAEE